MAFVATQRIVDTTGCLSHAPDLAVDVCSPGDRLEGGDVLSGLAVAADAVLRPDGPAS